MIPVLMPSDTTPARLQYNGYGFLKDCISCKVTEELNRTYELELTAPFDSKHIADIEPDMIIKAKAGDKEGQQAFRVYRISKPINRIAKIYAQHISYDLALNPVSPFSSENISTITALNLVLRNCCYSHNFSAWTDKSTVSSLNIGIPTPARKCLGGVAGSILDNFGGEYEFDNFTVKLHTARGTDTGVTFYYGKNLTNFLLDTNIQNVATAIYPYVKTQNDEIITLPEKVIQVSSFGNYSEPRAAVIDFSDKFSEDETITESALRNKANVYISSNAIDSIYQNLDISFVQLWKTEEYKGKASLERIGMGDIVNVRYFQLGVTAKAKVVKTVYDSLTEQYEKIEIGSAKVRG